MPILSRDLRRELERVVTEARRVGEAGARKALEQFAVHHHEPWGNLTPEQRALRNRLRAHGRQLGDRLDGRGNQTVGHLAQECAYEHWHRMLFARFLAESNLLIEPETGVPISLAECRELARERGTDWLALTSEFAVRMLPQIFRPGDPVLQIVLPPETRHELEKLLKSLPGEVFTADDSLGWVYQFWQAEKKKEVNESGVKIGADELPAVTELFTEDYMVYFLLHNTLGAWWTAKKKAEGRNPDLPGYQWRYLRLKDDGTPAASFDGWPRAAKDIKVLDPSMGSGHFLVFALPILVGFRMEEEGLSREQAVEAVLRDNLFGLELDPRCTQIAAFNLAWTAWRMVGYRPLPQLNLACSGLGINAKEDDWLKLGGKDARVRETMQRLYHLFQQAPVLGSLIDPKRVGGNLFIAEFEEVRPLLERALAAEQGDEKTQELAVTASGLLEAVRILAGEFTLVATNVPYLGRGKQDDVLKEYSDRYHPTSKADLATTFLERCIRFCHHHGTTTIVTQQTVLFLVSYEALRRELLRKTLWNIVARLGEHAFDSSQAAGAFVALLVITSERAAEEHRFLAIDAAEEGTPVEKSEILRAGTGMVLTQAAQLRSPSAKIVMSEAVGESLLAGKASSFQGIKTGDDNRVRRFFWEVAATGKRWRFFQSTVLETQLFGGMECVIDWQDDGEGLARRQGLGAWDKRGVMVSQMRELPVALYLGDIFDSNASPIVPHSLSDLSAIWAFCSSPTYVALVRTIDSSLKPTNTSLVQVPFDAAHWNRVAAERYPRGLPDPHSDDPTQWLFTGHTRSSEQPLQVAAARLLGYRWPRQTGSSFTDCPALGPDGLEAHADADGIVCLSSLRGEPQAADRLRALLADAFGSEWSAAKQAELLAQVGYRGKSLEEWLREGFFEQHCDLFHQRPFIWHLWDGLRDGFHALVNYHKLDAPGGEGRRTLEKLAYGYLGDWIERQRADQKSGLEGSDARLAAALHLKSELEKILEGEPPYDIFVRWKPLHQQPIGWEPDINDGVRINIRPFTTAKPLNGRARNACILRVTPKIKWDKDRGKEPHRPKDEFPWFWSWNGQAQDFLGGREFDGNRWNDLHYSCEAKQEALERHAAREQKDKLKEAVR